MKRLIRLSSIGKLQKRRFLEINWKETIPNAFEHVEAFKARIESTSNSNLYQLTSSSDQTFVVDEILQGDESSKAVSNHNEYYAANPIIYKVNDLKNLNLNSSRIAEHSINKSCSYICIRILNSECRLDLNSFPAESIITLLISHSNITIPSGFTFKNLTILVDNSMISLESVSPSTSLNMVSEMSEINFGTLHCYDFNIYSRRDIFKIKLLKSISDNSLLWMREHREFNFLLLYSTAIKMNIYYAKDAKFEKILFMEREGFSFCPTLVIDHDQDLNKSNFLSFSEFRRGFRIFVSVSLILLSLSFVADSLGESRDIELDQQYTFLKISQAKLGNSFKNNKI